MSKPVYIVPMNTAHAQGNAVAQALGVLSVYSEILNNGKDILWTEGQARICKEVLEMLEAAQDQMIRDRKINYNYEA